MSLRPKYEKKKNFYLKAKQKPTPKQWYASQVVGSNSIGNVVKELMKAAKIEGFFTNHSLRRTGSTRLFRAGIDRKLVKEVTGHRSDAVDTYQITSDLQRQEMSKIIQNNNVSTGTGVRNEPVTELKEIVVGKVDKSEEKERDVCKCKCRAGDQAVTTSNVGLIVEQLMKASKTSNGKTVIKIQIEISNE